MRPPVAPSAALRWAAYFAADGVMHVGRDHLRAATSYSRMPTVLSALSVLWSILGTGSETRGDDGQTANPHRCILTESRSETSATVPDPSYFCWRILSTYREATRR
jgi:hypothetical protein